MAEQELSSGLCRQVSLPGKPQPTHKGKHSRPRSLCVPLEADTAEAAEDFGMWVHNQSRHSWVWQQKVHQSSRGLAAAPQGRCKYHGWNRRVPSQVAHLLVEEEELRNSPIPIPTDPHPEVDVHEMPFWALVSDVMFLRLTSGAAVEAPARS